MLIECRAILPTRNYVFEKYLADTFGGYTVWQAGGGWINDDGQLEAETVNVYVVAVRPTLIGLLRSTFKVEAVNQKQKTLYFASYGYAEIVELEVQNE